MRDARKTMAGRQRKDGAARRGARAFAVGDACNSARGILTFQCRRTQALRIRVLTVIALQIGEGACCQTVSRSKSSKLVFRGLARHIKRAVHQLGQHIGIHAGRGNCGRTLPDKNAKANILAF